MEPFDISYNDIAGAPLGSGKKKVAPIQAAQGIAAPTAALSSPQLIDARQSITQAPTGPMISQEVKDGLANGAAQAFSSTLGAIQKSGDAAQRTAGEGNYGGAIGHVIRGAAGGIAGIGDDVMRSAAKVLDPAANALKTLVTGDGTPINQAASQSAAVKTIADVVQPGGQQSYRPGSATANALNETDAYPQSRPGDPLAKDSTPQKPGRNAEGVITAGSAKDAMGEDMQRSGGVFGTMDMKGVNDIMARENQARGEMIDSMIKANGGNGIGIMGDGGIEADNAEKTARWRQDDLLAKARFNPAAGQVALESARGQNHIAAETVRGGNQMATEQGRNAVAMRGQNINAQNEANRLAIDAPYRTEQAAGLREQNRSAAVIADLQNKALAGDARAIETLRALNGKGESNFMPVTKKVYNELGQVVGEDVGAFDKRTGQAVGVGGQQKSFTKAEVDSALAKGADKTKIAERIKSMGGNPADHGL